MWEEFIFLLSWTYELWPPMRGVFAHLNLVVFRFFYLRKKNAWVKYATSAGQSVVLSILYDCENRFCVCVCSEWTKVGNLSGLQPSLASSFFWRKRLFAPKVRCLVVVLQQLYALFFVCFVLYSFIIRPVLSSIRSPKNAVHQMFSRLTIQPSVHNALCDHFCVRSIFSWCFCCDCLLSIPTNKPQNILQPNLFNFKIYHSSVDIRSVKSFNSWKLYHNFCL